MSELCSNRIDIATKKKQTTPKQLSVKDVSTSFFCMRVLEKKISITHHFICQRGKKNCIYRLDMIQRIMDMIQITIEGLMQSRDFYIGVYFY